MFVTRLISGIVLITLAFVLIISGGPVLYCGLLIISLIGLSEFYKVVGVLKKDKISGLAAAGFLGSLLYYLVMLEDPGKYQLEVCMLIMILILIVYVVGFSHYKAETAMAAFFGVLYVPVMLSYIYQTRNLLDGSLLVWLIFIASWGSDTCAYCVGMGFHKLYKTHPMAPVLSPKKSIEGAVGGIVGAALIGVIYSMVFHHQLRVLGNPQLACGIICGVGSVISQAGDLAASAIKRNHNVKDYGKLIPGHGGILDRFDSVIFTAPIIYFLSVLFIEKGI